MGLILISKRTPFGTDSFAPGQKALSRTCLASAPVKEAEPVLGHCPRRTACFTTAWAIMGRHTQTDDFPCRMTLIYAQSSRRRFLLMLLRTERGEDACS